MSRLFALSAVLAWVGATLLLSRLRWFSRPSLTSRLRPYVPGGLAPIHEGGILSAHSFREVIAPLAQTFGERVARLFGVSEELATRLRRIHSPLTITAFRTRQLGWSVLACGVGIAFAFACHLPAGLWLGVAFGAPLLAFLVLEQRVQTLSSRRQRRLFLELPVISEQLGMLLSAGFSLGAALNRLAQRGRGECAVDIALVCGRIRQGLTEIDALREWADIAQVEAVNRLVSVLSLNRTAGDLGVLITDEARAIRDDAHRELLETIERRGQQVWVPVTVATLVPGVMFMAVPFIEAMRLFAS